MNVTHPDGNRIIVMVEGISMLAEVEVIGKNVPGWVALGYIGGYANMFIDHYDWNAFVKLVGECDAIAQGGKV